MADRRRGLERLGPVAARLARPATEIMLDMAQIGPGSRVLDVAAGAGEQTLQAAARVGPAGTVLATDIAPNILDFAAAEARARRLSQRSTPRCMDGEDLDVPEGTFDAVISRVGLIYFPDQQKALAGMRRALKPGGRVAAIVYTTPENNRFFSIPVSIIRRRANLPPPLPGQPGPFSLGGAGVLEEALRKAGFRDVESRTVPAPVRSCARPPNACASSRSRSAPCTRCWRASTRPAAKPPGARSKASWPRSKARPASPDRASSLWRPRPSERRLISLPSICRSAS